MVATGLSYAGKSRLLISSIAYPWYTFLIVVSTTALPAVIAKLTAEYGAKDDLDGQALVFDVSRRLMAILGVITLVFLSLSAPFISSATGYPGSLYFVCSPCNCFLFCSDQCRL